MLMLMTKKPDPKFEIKKKRHLTPGHVKEKVGFDISPRRVKCSPYVQAETLGTNFPFCAGVI